MGSRISVKAVDETRPPITTMVSLTIDHDTDQLMAITGLSMAGHAQPVTDPADGEKILRMLAGKYPEQKNFPLAMPKPTDVRLFRVRPTVVSVPDYSKGFGHTDLVTARRMRDPICARYECGRFTG